jgi:hypothetical protein
MVAAALVVVGSVVVGLAAMGRVEKVMVGVAS